MRAALLALPLLAAACTQTPLSPLDAARVCEQRARQAQGPSGSVSVGANSRSGLSTGISIGVTDDYLRGRDPYEVYEDCVVARSGQPPVRPPRLR
ncbi:hypothetical protein FHS00_002338 [Limimaricola variabilis]|jgi:hypothetical protein|uniref:Lipoprotein n=1 Tax=Limimaricola variabilis TaxID=1492771 RepID=A0ABR6HQB1_9RHOB|nr:hypothetical protein [Limimaricola variabilis]MBB3712743.1 hypothetical protein [Limimaricola variabilis]WPY93344.1 hypothetical protein T8T21_09415 [Limimaricola variabilis]